MTIITHFQYPNTNKSKVVRFAESSKTIECPMTHDKYVTK
jgi:hypothetical protein